MNKKAIIRVGAIFLFILVFLTIFVFVINSKRAIAEINSVYYLSDKVKINLEDVRLSNYTKIKIKTPSTEYISKINSKELIFSPSEIGEYKIVVYTEEDSRELNFIVKSESERNIVFNEMNESNQTKEDVIKNSTISNATDIDNSNNFTNFGISDKIINYSEYAIVINKEVLWKEKIDAADSDKKIKLPKNAKNATLYIINNSEKIKREFIVDDKSLINGIMSAFSNEEEFDYIKVEKNTNELEFEYYTSAPVAREETISENKKIMKITSEEGLDYANVIAYTQISEKIKMSEKEKVKIYWREEGRYLDFNAYDTNNNGLIDYVDWIVPHLSEQNFEIILITKAEHLNENRIFIGDVFEKVEKKDDVWVLIPENNYIRVTFQKKLSNVNDITIYPRIISGNPIVEIYEFNKTQKLAEFSNIISNVYNKVYLSNLISEQDVFDLRIVNGSLEFDHIIDPPEDGGYLIFNDTFTDTTGDSIYTAHTPNTGTGWTEIYSDASNLIITGNLLDGDGGNSDGSFGYNDISGNWKNDQIAKVTYTTSATGDDLSHLVVRSDATLANAYVFTWSATAANTVLWRRVSSANTNLNTSCGPDGQFASGDLVSLKVVGSLIQVYDGNTLVCQAIDTSLSSGRTGVGLGSSPRDTAGDQQGQRLDNFASYLFNRAPNAPTVLINSTDGTNNSLSNLNCYSTITDNDGTFDSLNVSVRWYKNGILNFSIDYNNSYSNGTLFVSTLNYQNLSMGQNWSCSQRLFDGYNYTSFVNSSNLTILALPKPNINIISPLSQNYTTTTIYFNVSLNQDGGYCGFSLDGTPNVTMTKYNNTYFNYTNISMAQGQHFVVFACNNTEGNMNASSGIRYFGVDNINPLVNIINPLNITYTTTSIQFNFSLNEAGTCLYSLNNGATNYTMTANASRTGFNATNVSIADGSYTVRAYCNDTAGNRNLTTSQVFSKDTLVPQVNITYPQNITYTTTSIQFNFSLNEAGTCMYSLNNGVTNYTMSANASSSGFNASNASIAQGNYTVRAYCNDTSGNRNYTSIRGFSILTPAPLIENTSCYDGSSWINCSNIGWGENIRIRTNCTSQIGGTVNNVTFQLRNIEDNKLYFNQTVTSQTAGFWEYNSGLNINDSGTFNLHLTCRENPTSEEDFNWTVAWGNLTVDLINPNTNTSVGKGYFFNFTSQINCIGGECGNVNATLDPISYVRSNGTAGTSFNLNIGSADNRLVVIFAGDESAGTNLTGATVDGKACSRVAVADNALSGTNHQEMWYCDEDNLGSSNGVVTVAITGGDASWGAHAHLYTGVIQTGPSNYGVNQTVVGGTTITVRGINVSTGGLVVAGWGEGNGGFSINSQTSPLTTRQNGPDPSSADLFSSGGIESTDQINKTYSVTLSAAMNRGTGIVASWDSAGGTKGIISTVVGTTPFYTINQNPRNYSTTSCLGSMVNGSSCNTTWSVNATGAINSTWDFFVFANSTNYINVSSGISSHINITIIELDLTAPLIYNITPVTGSYINNPVNLTAITNENANCQYSTSFTFNYGSGTDFTFGQGSLYHSVFLGNLSEGAHAYYIKCNDSSGNYNSNINQNSTAFTVDNINPLVTIVSPQNLGYNVSSILFNFTLNEAGTCMYSLNNGTTNYTMSANPARTEFNATNSTMANGQYTVRAYCNDTTGNRNYSVNQTFYKDIVSPNATLISPNNSLITNVSLQNMSVNITDNVMITNATLFIYNSTNSLINQTTQVINGGTQALVGIIYNFLYDGVFTWFYRIYDIGGNLFTTTNNTITIDSLPPQLTINYPLDGSTLADVTPTLNISLDNNVSSLWYSSDFGATNITICNSCGGTQTTFLYFNESNRTITVYANNSFGILTSDVTSFRIFMNYNYFDTFNDNSSVLTKSNGVNWQTGNISFTSVLSNPFWDDFEGTLAKWDGNGATNWDLSATYFRTGIQGVRANNGNEGDITTDNIDASSSTQLVVSFWYYPVNLEDADVDVYFYNGTTYNLVDNIGGDGVQNAWNYIEFSVDDSQYFKSNFRLRLNANLGATEIFGVDDVNITSNTVLGNRNNFTSYPINTTEPIMEFSKITWTESETDTDNNLSVQVSANNGTNWYNATNGNGIYGIQNGSSLIYRVLSDTVGTSMIYLSDMNITWSNAISIAPRILINSPLNNTSQADVTPTLNITLLSVARTLWYTLDDGVINVTLCNDCTGTKITFLYLKEGNFTVKVYANNSLGSISSNMSSFNINMNYNYFDTFNDNSSVISKTEGVNWYSGKLSFVPSSSFSFSDGFETDLSKWDGNLATAWDLSTAYNYTGLQSIRANNGNEGDLTSDNINASGAVRIKISYWYYPIALEDADADTIFYNGLNYKTADNFGTDGPASTWSYKEYNITDSQYFVSNFRLRFNANMGAGETLALDNVTVTIYNSLTDYGTRGNFTAYSINTTDKVAEILNITWLESGTNSTNYTNKNMSVQVSANNGTNWYNATKGNGIYGIVSGTNLTYRVLFNNNDSTEVSLLDMNISWTNKNYPKINIIYPINTLYTINVSELNYTLTNTTSVESCWYSNSSGRWNSSIVSAGINFSGVTSKEGNNSWTVYCNNTEGNVRGVSVNFIKDTLSPNGTLIFPLNNTFSNNVTKNMTVNASDGAGLNNVTLFVYNSSNSLINQTTRVLTGGTQALVGIVYNFLYDGVFTWFYRIVDIGNHEFNTQNNTITIDRVLPNVNITYPLNNFIYSLNVSNLNYTYNDSYPGVCWYSLNSGTTNSTLQNPSTNWTELTSLDGANIWTVYCNDTSGNLQTSNVYFIKNTFAYPQINFTNPTHPDGSFVSRKSVPLNISVTGLNISEIKFNWNETNFTTYNNSLIAMYNFNNRSLLSESSISNLTYDSSINRNNGFCSGMGAGCNYTSGKYGKAIWFAGTNDYVNITGLSSNSKSYTISLWAKSTLNNVQMHLFDAQSGRFVLAWRSDTTNLGFFDTSWKYFGATPNDGNWHHLVLVLDNSSSSVTLYLDGVQSGATGVYSSNLNISGNVTLGSRFSADTNFFIGGMDEVRIWNKAFSSNEIFEMYVSNLEQKDLLNWNLYVNQSANISSGLNEGLYTYFGSVKDVSNNENITEKRNVTIDTIKPLVNIEYPTNITYNSTVSELNYTYFDINPNLCWYSNNTGRNNYSIQSYNLNFSNVYSVEGYNNWTVYCNDTAGNLNSSMVRFIRDMLGPNGTLISPLNNTFANNLTQNMSVNASDGVGLSNVTLFVYNSSNSLINQTTRVLSGGTQALVGIVYNFLYDGVFTWFYRIVDTGNMEFLTRNNTITIDRVSPLVTILSPENITYGSGSSVPFIFSLDEAGTCLYSLNGGTKNYTMTANASRTGFNASNGTLTDGFYTVNAYCNDSAGNRNYTESQTFNVNTTAPKLTIISPISKIYNVSFIDFNVSSNENLTFCKFTINNWITNYSMTQFNSTYFNYTNVSVNDGNYLARFWCNDTLNNANSTTSVNFTVDTLFPQISFGTRTANDGANVSQNYIYVNVSLIEANLVNITYNLYNSSGIINSTTFFNRTLFYNFTNVSEGYYTYNVTVIDVLNQTNSTLTYNILLDRTIPNGTLISPNNSLITNISIQNMSANASDNFGLSNATLFVYNSSNSLINQTTRVLSGGTQALVGIVYNFLYDGVFTWFYRIVDYASNQFSTTNNTIIVDTRGPRINITYPLNKSYNYDISELNYTIFELNPSSCWYVINGGSPTYITCGQNVSGLTANEGQNNWTIYANDTFGYFNYTEVLFVKDTINPLVSIINPLNTAYGNVTINFNFSLNEEGTCLYSLDSGIKNYTMTANASRTGFSASNSTMADGTYTVNAYCNDTAGNNNHTVSQTFTKDSISPIITIISPINQIYNFSSIDFNVSLDKNSSICRFTLDNWITNYSMTQFNLTYFNYTNASVNDGNYLARFWCNDTLNNPSTASVNFTVDTLFPQISFGTRTANDGANVSQNYIYVNISLIEANLVNITYNLYNSSGIINSTTFFNRTLFYNFTNVSEGYYTYNVTVIDILNQTNSTATYRILLDRTIPNGTLISPNNSLITNISIQNMSVNASDNFGLSNVTLFVYNSSNSLINQTTQILSGGTEALVGIVYNFLYDGVFTWFYRIVDYASNQFSTTNNTITVDTHAPRINLNITNNSFFKTNNVILNYTPIDAVGLGECRLFIDGVFNMTNQSAILTNQLNNFSLTLNDNRYNWYVDCFDYMNFTNVSETRIFGVDTSYPKIDLISPSNNINILRNYLFNFTVNDNLDTNLTCNLYIDNNLNQSNISVINDSIKSVQINNINLGQHSWNVSCFDDANNLNFSENRIFNVTLPDLMTNTTSIYFNNSAPRENENTLITATIYNLHNISISNVTVQFYMGDPTLGGVQINTNQTISVSGLSQTNVSVGWNANMGSNVIFVIIDPPIVSNGSIWEWNETNNLANISINIDGWHYVYGDINSQSEFQLADTDENNLIRWENTNFSEGNIYVSDYESQIYWPSLKSIGKNISGSNATNDFADIDTLLNMTSFSDSVYNIYTQSGILRNISTYKIFNNYIFETPVANSINNSNFITGILWDSSDNTNSEFDTTDKEDLVFITKINQNQQGAYGVYDYEIRIPAKLRVYKTNQNTGVLFYTEIY